MSKHNFKRIDEKEKERIDELAKTFESGREITIDEVFDSKIIPKILEEKPLSYTDSFHEPNSVLPLNCLLYSRILMTICPYCNCVKNPEIIRPLLENGMVLPILAQPLEEYSADFANLVIQYPYIGVNPFSFLRFVQIFTANEGAVCAHCFGEICKRNLKKLSETKGDKKRRDFFKGLLVKCTFPKLYPNLEHEFQILKEIENAIDQKNMELLLPLADKTEALFTLRNSQMFEAVPEASQNDLSNIGEILRKMNLSLDSSVIDKMEEKKWAIKALNIDYNPAMPVEDYLNIILPRRKKINSLVNELISRNEKEKSRRLSEIEDEIWKINQEVSSSKAIEMLTFSTNFVSDNAQILFGMLMGGLIGYSSGSFAGCSIGSMAGLVGGVAEKLVSKHGVFKVSKHPRKTMEWIKEKIESPEERLLSLMLAKDIKVIQIWALRKKLKKT